MNYLLELHLNIRGPVNPNLPQDILDLPFSKGRTL